MPFQSKLAINFEFMTYSNWHPMDCLMCTLRQQVTHTLMIITQTRTLLWQLERWSTDCCFPRIFLHLTFQILEKFIGISIKLRFWISGLPLHFYPLCNFHLQRLYFLFVPHGMLIQFCAICVHKQAISAITLFYSTCRHYFKHSVIAKELIDLGILQHHLMKQRLRLYW